MVRIEDINNCFVLIFDKLFKTVKQCIIYTRLIAEPPAKSSISSRIALLGANINVASLSPGDPGKPKQFNPFSPPTSRVNSNANSRENTSDNCLTSTDLQEGSDNRSFIGTTVKNNNSVPGEMIHVS